MPLSLALRLSLRLLVVCHLILSGPGLNASPGLGIRDFDATAFPQIRLTIDRKSRTGRPTGNDSSAGLPFILTEFYGNRSAEVQLLESRPSAGLHYILVLDATLSLKKRQFALLKDHAVQIVQRLSAEDSAALYRINSEPSVLTPYEREQSVLVQKIKELKQTGRKTRIFDALYAALLSGRQVQDQGQKPVVVLMTDGKDEGSYLSRADCLELISVSHKERIPVYVLLYDAAKDQSLYTQLALKSGGLLALPARSGLQRMFDHIARPDLVYSVRYRSRLPVERMGLNFWQSRQVRLEVTDPSGGPVVSHSYEITLRQWMDQALQAEKMGGLALMAAGLFVLFFLLVAGLVFLIVLIRAFSRPEPAATIVPAGAEEKAAVAASAQDDLAGPTVVGEAVTEDLVPAFQRAPRDPYEVYIEQETRELLQEPEPGPMRISMKDYAYRMLQNALREGKAYRTARLRLTGARERVYDLFLDSVVIGRGSIANIHIADSAMSEIHARIRRVDQKFILYDMLSAGGVFVNGKRILRPRALFDGDSVRMGHSHFLFEGRA